MPDAGALARQAALAARVTGLLLASGQTTERVALAVDRLAAHFGIEITILPAWGETILRATGAGANTAEFVAVAPAGVDMRKVTATMRLVDAFCDGRADLAATEGGLAAVAGLPPIPLLRFAALAGAGAAALAIVFGAVRLPEIMLIAALGATGAVLRRWLAGRTTNLFVQPLSAALLAGVVAAIALRLAPAAISSLTPLCPCMILVPGPHLLNGALDLIRGRLPLGTARVVYAGLTILMICIGLLLGLALGGASLPADAPGGIVPLASDVVPAGIAVLAYGTFFSMPWRMLPIPVAVGMVAHAVRWALVVPAHASPVLGAFCACLLVGTVMTPVADRLHLPFAGCAFACVVSLIPGVYLFRAAGSMAALVGLGDAAPPGVLVGAATEAVTASMILVAIAAGLLVPKLVLGRINWRLSQK